MHLNLRDPIFSQGNEVVEGYQLSFSQRLQILPINIVAEELHDFWTKVTVAADAKRQTNPRFLPVSYGNLQILFESGDGIVPFNSTALVLLARSMKDRMCVGEWLAGFCQGTRMN